MRIKGTLHSGPDAQRAWDEGRMAHWPEARHPRAMGYYRRADIPFQFALAEASTICDACHCAVQTGTNTNRLLLWSRTNDPVIRFLETRFGIHQPNIASWRRAICGDLTSAFDFAAKDVATPPLPDPGADSRRAAALTGQVSPTGRQSPPHHGRNRAFAARARYPIVSK